MLGNNPFWGLKAEHQQGLAAHIHMVIHRYPSGTPWDPFCKPDG